MRHNTVMRPLQGSFWVLVQYDVAEQIDLDKPRNLVRSTWSDQPGPINLVQ
jgi:hypothetical protein